MMFMLAAHSAAVTGCMFSANNKRIVTSSEDKTMRVWNAADGASLHVVTGHRGAVNTVAIHPNARLIASGGDDAVVLVVDTLKKQNMVLNKTLLGHKRPIKACAILDEGCLVASVSTDRIVILWNGRSGVPLSTFRCERTASDHDVRPEVSPHFVTSLDFSQDGKRLVTGSTDRTVLVWNIEGFQNKCIRVFETPVFQRVVIAQAEDGGGGGGGGGGAGGSAAGGAVEEESGVDAVRYSRPSKAETVLMGSRDGNLRLWGGVMQSYSGHSRWVMSVASALDGRKLATASLDGTVRIWDAPSGIGEADIPANHTAEVSACCISGDGLVVVTASRDETLRVWDSNGTLLSKLTVEAPVTCCDITLDGRQVLFGCYNKNLYLWGRTRSDEMPALVTSHERALSSCAFNRRGNLVVSGCGRSTDFDGISAKVLFLFVCCF